VEIYEVEISVITDVAKKGTDRVKRCGAPSGVKSGRLDSHSNYRSLASGANPWTGPQTCSSLNPDVRP